ncbi:MAG: hypothetical protein QW526_08715 [Candidatus Jordarchaeales archaeon]
MEGGVKLWKRVIISVVLVFSITTLAFSTTMLNTPVVAAYVLTESGAQPLQTTTTGKTIITGLHTVQSPVNITGLSTIGGTISITANGATNVTMGPGVTMTGLNGQPFTTEIYANSFTQAEPLPPGSIAQTLLVGSQQYPAVFQANGNITIGAIYNSTGKIVGGCLDQTASDVYMKVNSSRTGVSGFIGDPLSASKAISSDTRTCIKVSEGTLTIYTQEYQAQLTIGDIQIGGTANVWVRINSTHVNFTIELLGNYRSAATNITPYGGICNLSQLAHLNKLPTITFTILILYIRINLNDVILQKEQENNYYNDVISMSWSSGTVFEVWTGAGINPMRINRGVVQVNNSEFLLKSNSTVMMGFMGSGGTKFGVRVDRSPGFNYSVVPLVRISALSLFADSWGGSSYMQVRDVTNITMSNVKAVSDSQFVTGGATVTVNGYQEYPVSTVLQAQGMNLTGSLLLERDYGAGRRYVFEVQGNISMPSGSSYISADLVQLSGDSVISGVVSINGKMKIVGSLMSVGDSDVNGVSVLRNAVMAASGVIEVEGSQLINGSLTMTNSTTDIGVSGILIDGCVRVDGSLRVSGTLTIMGNATMNGEIIEMSGSSKITGHVELSGSMNTNNLLTGTVSLTASSLVTSGSTVIRDGRIDVVNGVLKVTKAGTEIACSVKIMGDIESTGTLTLSNARISGTTLIMAPTITYGATLVRGLMQILMSQSLPASMLINPMFTFGQVTMAQSMIVGSTNIEGTMTVTPNNVIITGTTEIVGALNAFTAPLIGVGSTVAMQSASALTSAGPLSLPSLALALSPLNLAMFALIGAIVARIIVPPVALAAGRAARRVQKKYFAPETRAYMLYYRTRTRLSNAAKLTVLLTRYAAMKTRESIFNAVSRPASRMASVELALQQQRKKLPMWFKSWHDKFLSRRLRRTRRIRMPRLRR